MTYEDWPAKYSVIPKIRFDRIHKCYFTVFIVVYTVYTPEQNLKSRGKIMYVKYLHSALVDCNQVVSRASR